MSSGRRKNSKKKKASIKKTELQNFTYTQGDVFFMMKDTSELIRQENATRLSSMGPAASESNTLTDSVEFWNWMNRNYEKSTHFASSENMKRYMEGTTGEKAWAKKVIQGKGYEWDWMSSQRRQIKNLFKTFDAGDVANRPGSDVTVHDIITGTDKEQQLKAYTSKNTPHLKNTPTDMTVVTNAEKVDTVKKLGYGEKDIIIQYLAESVRTIELMVDNIDDWAFSPRFVDDLLGIIGKAKLQISYSRSRDIENVKRRFKRGGDFDIKFIQKESGHCICWQLGGYRVYGLPERKRVIDDKTYATVMKYYLEKTDR